MNTLLLNPDDQGIAVAAELLLRGELVAFPTETVYGLGAPVFLPTAIAKIFHVKKRPQDNPLIVHASSIEEVSRVASNIPDIFYKLAEAFWPGPLTIILPKNACIPPIVSANQETVGVRVPAHPIAKRLIAAVGMPLVAPSANLSGRPSSTRKEHVLEDFEGRIAAVLDGGPCQYGLESTVLSLIPRPTILRPGAISLNEISKVLGTSVHYATHKVDKPLSPGMKYRHYAPKGRVLLFTCRISFQMHLQNAPNKSRMVLDPPRAEELFACFREADQLGYEEILVICDARVSSDAALMNRLSRAAEN